MRIAFSLFFLTLVVSTARAAPETSLQVEPIQTKETEVPSEIHPTNDLTVQITPAPPNRMKSPVYRKLSNSTNNVGLGMLSGQMKRDHEYDSATALHFQRTQYNQDESAQEFGMSLLTNVLLGVDVGYKKLCCFQSPVQPFEPFYKLGLAALYEPKDALGNIIDYRKYFFQVGAGFENLFSSRRTLRAELGIRSGYSGQHVYGLLIYAFPD